MIVITLYGSAGEEEQAQLITLLEQFDLDLLRTTELRNRRVIICDIKQFDERMQCMISGQNFVEKVQQIATSYHLASRVFQTADTRIEIGLQHSCHAVTIGDPALPPIVIAGPCAVESQEQLLNTAQAVKAAGAQILRGGAFKPRTSPYHFQGLGREGLELLGRARELTGLPIVTEVMEPAMVEVVAEDADVLQIGCRNMQNFPLLRAVGEHSQKRPVLLKRSLSATIDEWLLAAEYILLAGNPNVILCERGIRSYDPSTRNILDLTSVPLLRAITHLPVIVDPSHATGRRELVPAMSRASIAAGAKGLLIEAHIDPDSALCDGRQSVHLETLQRITREVTLMSQILSMEEIATSAAEGMTTP